MCNEVTGDVGAAPLRVGRSHRRLPTSDYAREVLLNLFDSVESPLPSRPDTLADDELGLFQRFTHDATVNTKYGFKQDSSV